MIRPEDVTDAIMAEIAEIAQLAAAGTDHAEHDGWAWLYPSRILRCVCGAVLVRPALPPDFLCDCDLDPMATRCDWPSCKP